MQTCTRFPYQGSSQRRRSKRPTGKPGGLSPSRLQPVEQLPTDAGRTEEFGAAYTTLRGGTSSTESPTEEKYSSFFVPRSRKKRLLALWANSLSLLGFKVLGFSRGNCD